MIFSESNVNIYDLHISTRLSKDPCWVFNFSSFQIYFWHRYLARNIFANLFQLFVMYLILNRLDLKIDRVDKYKFRLLQMKVIYHVFKSLRVKQAKVKLNHIFQSSSIFQSAFPNVFNLHWEKLFAHIG